MLQPAAAGGAAQPAWQRYSPVPEQSHPLPGSGVAAAAVSSRIEDLMDRQNKSIMSCDQMIFAAHPELGYYTGADGAQRGHERDSWHRVTRPEQRRRRRRREARPPRERRHPKTRSGLYELKMSDYNPVIGHFSLATTSAYVSLGRTAIGTHRAAGAVLMAGVESLWIGCSRVDVFHLRDRSYQFSLV